MLLNPVLHLVPYILNWVEVWAVRRPFNNLNASLAQLFQGELGRVRGRIILHELMVRIHTNPAINQRNNSLTIALLIDCPPLLLLEEAGPF
jgi:hypothetical protein